MDWHQQQEQLGVSMVQMLSVQHVLSHLSLVLQR
jgi:hypothetical protein